MQFTRKIPFKRDGKDHVLTLDRFNNFVSMQELEEGESSPEDPDETVHKFFTGEGLSGALKRLHQKFKESITPLLAPGVDPTEVRDMLVIYEGAALRQMPGRRTLHILLPDAKNLVVAPAGVPGAQVKPPHSPDPTENEIMSKFLDLDAPCFFPKCAALRQDMAAAIKAAGGEGCSSCELGRIKTQFATRALQMSRQSPEP